VAPALIRAAAVGVDEQLLSAAIFIREAVGTHRAPRPSLGDAEGAQPAPFRGLAAVRPVHRNPSLLPIA
jgi:hypothetical protein